MEKIFLHLYFVSTSANKGSENERKMEENRDVMLTTVPHNNSVDDMFKRMNENEIKKKKTKEKRKCFCKQ